MSTHWELLRDAIPADHARQANAVDYVERLVSGPDAPALVVDLGCGKGESASLFRRHNPGIAWVGIDIEESREVSRRTRRREMFVSYDGVHLPFRTGSIPLIYSNQVLEHVRYPGRLLSEVSRVLTAEGVFTGSTSQMEPYHSRSLWNFTVYGFKVLVEDAGLELDEVRPSIDGVTLTMRAYHGRTPEYRRFFREASPLNQEIDAWARATGRSPALANNRKLMFCGQFAFLARKPTPEWSP